MHTLTGNIVHTIKIRGLVKQRPITIHIGSGITNNCLDTEVANQVGCSVQHTYSLMVSKQKGV